MDLGKAVQNVLSGEATKHRFPSSLFDNYNWFRSHMPGCSVGGSIFAAAGMRRGCLAS